MNTMIALPIAATTPSIANETTNARASQSVPGLRARGIDHPDRVLLDLERELRDYFMESEPIRRALVNASAERDRFYPEMPHELKFRHRDHWMPFMQDGSSADREKAGIIPPGVIEYLRSNKYPRAGRSNFGASYREINARAREILKADDRWQKAKNQLQARLVAQYDVDENNRRWDKLEERRVSLMERALDSTASTFDGVMIKIRFRKWFGEYDPYLDCSAAVDEISTSICDELDAIAGSH